MVRLPGVVLPMCCSWGDSPSLCFASVLCAGSREVVAAVPSVCGCGIVGEVWAESDFLVARLSQNGELVKSPAR